MKLAVDLPASKPHRAGCGVRPGVPAQPQSTRGRWRALVLIGVHLLIAAHLWHASQGRTLAPLEPSEAGRYWTEGVLNAGLILLTLLIASTLLLGRFFCGWGCHVVALQDGSAWLLGKLGIRPQPIRSRLLSFVPLLAALELFLLPWFFHGAPDTARWELSTNAFFTRFPGPIMTVVTFFAIGLGAIWILGAKGFCSYGCPYGALFGIADRLTPTRILVSDACEGCGHCTAVCTSGVQVHTEVQRFGMVVDSGCMKCLDCVSACPKQALSVGFTTPARGLSTLARGESSQRRRSFDFSWPEEVAMALVFFGSLFALRGLYGLVPFLLAVILAVFAALGVIVAARLLLRPDVRFQGRALRAGGSWTRAGALAALGLGIYLGLVGHSAWLKLELRAGARALRAGLGPAAIQAPLRQAQRLALLPVPGLDFELGRQAELAGDSRTASADYERAGRRFPTDPGTQQALVRTRSNAEDYEGASLALENMLDLRQRSGLPLDRELVSLWLPDVLEWLRTEPDGIGPTLLIARFQLALGDRATALENLRKLSARHANIPRIEARLRQVEEPAAAARGSDR